jgi:hypothetical protein
MMSSLDEFIEMLYQRTECLSRGLNTGTIIDTLLEIWRGDVRCLSYHGGVKDMSGCEQAKTHEDFNSG